jgi:hypothetical protein
MNDCKRHIEKEDGKYVLYSEDKTKKLGTYATKAEAEEREKQILYFKNKGKK